MAQTISRLSPTHTPSKPTQSESGIVPRVVKLADELLRRYSSSAIAVAQVQELLDRVMGQSSNPDKALSSQKTRLESLVKYQGIQQPETKITPTKQDFLALLDTVYIVEYRFVTLREKLEQACRKSGGNWIYDVSEVLREFNALAQNRYTLPISHLGLSHLLLESKTRKSIRKQDFLDFCGLLATKNEREHLRFGHKESFPKTRFLQALETPLEPGFPCTLREALVAALNTKGREWYKLVLPVLKKYNEHRGDSDKIPYSYKGISGCLAGKVAMRKEEFCQICSLEGVRFGRINTLAEPKRIKVKKPKPLLPRHSRKTKISIEIPPPPPTPTDRRAKWSARP